MSTHASFPDSAESDEELIIRYLAGDEPVFRELIERHLQAVYSLALRLGAEAPDAEDIAQETFLKVWKNLHKFNPNQARFKTWLLRIARNTVIDHLRKRRPLSFSNFDEPEGGNTLTETLADELPLPDELLSQSINAHLLARALLQLPPAVRDVLELHYREGLTFEEIGQVLNAPTNTVKSRHRRALITLRDLLSKFNEV